VYIHTETVTHIKVPLNTYIHNYHAVLAPTLKNSVPSPCGAIAVHEFIMPLHAALTSAAAVVFLDKRNSVSIVAEEVGDL
jgi:hypothetical protein